MNTDERGYFDDAMTERAPGAIFEVSNTWARDSWRRSTSVLCSTSSACAASGLLPKSHFQ